MRLKVLASSVVLLALMALCAIAQVPPLRVVCIGDSLTAGDGDDGGKGYPGRLQARLQRARPGSKVANYGVAGQTSQMVLEGYEQHGSQVKQALAFHPDVACVWVGSNDLWYLYEYNNPTAADEAADVQKFRKRVRAIIEAFRTQHVRVVIALLDDQSKRPVARAGKAFQGISAAELVRMSRQVAAYNAVIREEAARLSATVVDFNATTIFVDPSTLSDDGNHPNARGYDRVTDVWWKAFAR